MGRNEEKSTRRMDGETAMAFAGDAFELKHPRQTWPEWLTRCTVPGYSKDKDGRFVVSLAVTPKATNSAFVYFKVVVDPVTAETTILVDADLSTLIGEELQGF
jgi:hypothetical protein